MRWKILTLLFVARAAMAFQFATIGAIGPLYESTFSISTTALGFLIGLYFLPGVFFSLAGGSLGARFGDKPIVVLGLGLMALGAAIMGAGENWNAQIAGRMISGIGGVFINVLMTKMVADWFSGREISTAIAIFITSWPAGIALALVVMPALATGLGLGVATWAMGLAIFVLTVWMALYYRSPDSQIAGSAPKGVLPRGIGLRAIVTGGIAWGLLNAALAVVFSFGPASLVERGFGLIEASASTSVVIWAVAVFGLAGGVVADRMTRPEILLYVSTLVMLLGMAYFPQTDNVLTILVIVGSATGLTAPLYVSLAAGALRKEERAIGMGMFYMLYYIIFAASPLIAGGLIDLAGNSNIAFFYGAALLGLTLVSAYSAERLRRKI